MFAVTQVDIETYKSHLPLYFPRSESEEEFVAYHVPDDIGNEDGEPVIEERQIRILGKPTITAAGSREITPYTSFLIQLLPIIFF